MPGPDLSGRRILVVEDDFLLSEDICEQIRIHNGEVLGPAATLEHGQTLLHRGPHPDGCILNIRLQNRMVYPLADDLFRMGIPFVFASGEHRDSIPAPYLHVPHFSKPIDMIDAAAALFPPAKR